MFPKYPPARRARGPTPYAKGGRGRESGLIERQNQAQVTGDRFDFIAKGPIGAAYR